MLLCCYVVMCYVVMLLCVIVMICCVVMCYVVMYYVVMCYVVMIILHGITSVLRLPISLTKTYCNFMSCHDIIWLTAPG